MSNPEASSVVFDREGWFFFFPLFGKPAVCLLTLFQIGKKLAVTFVVSLFNVYYACKCLIHVTHIASFTHYICVIGS